MADFRNTDASKRPTVAEPRNSNEASQPVFSVVRDDQSRLDQKIVDHLTEAALDRNPANAKTAIHLALSNGASAVDLADHYIPDIARTLGDQWCSDEMSFANVTIGVSRLQMMLRELGANWSGHAGGPENAQTILLVVPKDIYHTLGAVVLSGQLRRKGLSVKLLLGGTPREVAEQVARADYSAVFISSSRGEALESLRLIVDAIKTSVSDSPPIIIGGSILEVEPDDKVTALTGADYATRIPNEALEFCGLLPTTQDDAPQTVRT